MLFKDFPFQFQVMEIQHSCLDIPAGVSVSRSKFIFQNLILSPDDSSPVNHLFDV